MDIKRFETGPRMSQAVTHNGIVYLAGQVGEPGHDVAEQTRQQTIDLGECLACLFGDVMARFTDLPGKIDDAVVGDGLAHAGAGFEAFDIHD